MSIQQVQRHGETILPLNARVSLVLSQSHPGQWHIVKDGRSCDCKGYEYRGHCRHLAAVAPAVQCCDRCGATEDTWDRNYLESEESTTIVMETLCLDEDACASRVAAKAEKRPIDRSVRGLFKVREEATV